jgi:predicted O-linked N-acetylglucosamine transferase (SPINDLY family)
MGHTGKRMLLFARRSAPLQITWLGYVGTTGVPTMDAILADAFHVRPGEEAFYMESVLRMPHGYICYGPPVDAPPVAPLPALTTGRVTFGCFNGAAKYSQRMFAAWAEILNQVPGSRLSLKTGGLDDAGVRSGIERRFAKLGIAPERIKFEGWSKAGELLAAYHHVDLALDTQPYSGGLTTCEALWMGVPVITMPGQTFAGRHSTSHATNAGLGDFVAADLERYIRLAVDRANKLDQLSVLRGQIRERMEKSPLCDAPRFAEDLLNLLKSGCAAKAAGSRW